jgi:hypothetical protein
MLPGGWMAKVGKEGAFGDKMTSILSGIRTSLQFLQPLDLHSLWL